MMPKGVASVDLSFAFFPYLATELAKKTAWTEHSVG